MKNGRLFELLYLLVGAAPSPPGSWRSASRCRSGPSTGTWTPFPPPCAGLYPAGTGAGIRLMDQFVLDRCLSPPGSRMRCSFCPAGPAVHRRAGGGGGPGTAVRPVPAGGGGLGGVDFTDWGSGEQERENFRIVREGILGRRLLDFTYYASSGTRTRRRVEAGQAGVQIRLLVSPGVLCQEGLEDFFDLRGWRGLCLEQGGAFPDGRRSSWRFLPGTAAEWDP